jgi:hypothetical protein
VPTAGPPSDHIGSHNIGQASNVISTEGRTPWNIFGDFEVYALSTVIDAMEEQKYPRLSYLIAFIYMSPF